MNELVIHPTRALQGTVTVPGDKSISHRALLFGALAAGESQVEGFLPAGDCTATLRCIRSLGVQVHQHSSTHLTVRGRGLTGFSSPSDPLDCGRSGTTMRLLAGILAGQAFESVLTGDPQLLSRPMRRVTVPLRQMGADIEDFDGHGPLTIRGRRLHGGTHVLSVASAQVKSALLLAGLYASGVTRVQEPGPARDHTERMLAAMGVTVQTKGSEISLTPPDTELTPLTLRVPGDLSSAAFLIVAALLTQGSEIRIVGVGINPTRTGLLDVLRSMNASIVVAEEREEGGEPLADIGVMTSELQGALVQGEMVVRMIDEFPIFAVAATQAHGTTVVHDARELRVKETDRIATVVNELRRMGAHIETFDDGFAVEGPTPLAGARVASHGDHRLAMALAIAGLIAEGETTIEGASCIPDSFPGFVEAMTTLGARMTLR